MEYAFPPDIQDLVNRRMATGLYGNEDQLLRVALRSLSDYEESVADIQAGIEDARLHGTRSLEEVDAEIRRKLGFSR